MCCYFTRSMYDMTFVKGSKQILKRNRENALFKPILSKRFVRNKGSNEVSKTKIAAKGNNNAK